MQSPSRSTLPILPLHGPVLCSKYTPPFWWWWDLMATDQFEQVHLTNKKRHVLRSVLFLFHKVWEFRYLYWVPFCCEQITSQQKRSTMKKKQQKTTKKLNRSNAYHAPLSPVKCLWSSRLRSSSRITLSSNAAAASTVAFGSKSSSYGIKAVPLPSKISFCSTVLNQICLSKKWTKNTEQTTPQ